MAATEEKAKAAANREEKNDENDGQENEAVEKFPPEEEAALLAESNTSKTEANSLFASSKYEAAITKYDEAVATCPNYLDYELAVLRSNIAACHLKLEQWKETVSTATAALDGLDRIDQEEALRADEAAKAKAAEDDVEEEIVSSGAGNAATAPIEEDEEDAKRRKRKEDDEKPVALMTLFVIFVGLLGSGFVSLIPVVMSDLFGAEDLASKVGLLNSIMGLGAFAGPSAVYAIVSDGRDFSMAVLFSGLLMIVGGLMLTRMYRYL
ncbi:hypothetical protein BN1708_012392 [Verticillium longisporum]|uniref:Uncharacterized protein n=1 Tax=Verticillium longisporum TaxID=100787 RepID=A0A0G4L9C0_VERLO|nr:hypothetical protein BN1708_012392 [Verticillium longisporum]